MKIEFDWKKMLLSHVNVRAEQHGEDKEAAADVKFEVDVPNDFLSELSPSLKSAFYFYDDARSDLADQGKKEPGFLPHLKYPRLELPLRWSDEMAGASLSIRLIGGEGPIMELEAVKVNELRLSPKDGGTVSITFRAQCHPTPEQFGALASLVQRDVEVTLKPSELLSMQAAA